MNKVINGSDIIVKVGSKFTGHATSHTINITTETRDLTFKPVATAPVQAAKFKEKEATTHSCSISFEGMAFYNEEEGCYVDFAAMQLSGEPVEVSSFVRGKNVDDAPAPFLTGSFIITSTSLSTPAGDTTTYNGQLDNSGEFQILDKNFAI